MSRASLLLCQLMMSIQRPGGLLSGGADALVTQVRFWLSSFLTITLSAVCLIHQNGKKLKNISRQYLE